MFNASITYIALLWTINEWYDVMMVTEVATKAAIQVLLIKLKLKFALLGP